MGAFNWGSLHRWFVHDSLLHGDLLSESLQWVFSIQGLKLSRSILLHKLINREVATTDLDLDLAPFDFDHDATRAELVYALRLTHKHDLQLGLGAGLDVI